MRRRAARMPSGQISVRGSLEAVHFDDDMFTTYPSNFEHEQTGDITGMSPVLHRKRLLEETERLRL